MSSNSVKLSYLKNYIDAYIVPGGASNVIKSLCYAFKNQGLFLWGVRKEEHFSMVKKAVKSIRPHKFLFLIYASKIGFIGLGGFDSFVSSSSNIFWCDETDQNRYQYRFYIKLDYIAKVIDDLVERICVDPCSELSAKILESHRDKFIQVNDVDEYLKSKGIKDYKIQTAYIQTVGAIPEKKLYTIEYFDIQIQNNAFVDWKTLARQYRTYMLINNVLQTYESSLEKFAKINVLMHLLSGKNILLTGPPGLGKTSFLTKFLEELGIDYHTETGNPDWTTYDTIGGVSLRKTFRKGIILETIERSRDAIKNGKLYWLIIDEINRANVDLALGKVFTLMDPRYRLKEPIRLYGLEKVDEIYVPLSFRILATMNNYDRALLFKLGYALIRRFAIIDYVYLKNIKVYLNKYIESLSNQTINIRDKLLNLSTIDCSHDIDLNYNRIYEELTLCSSNLPNDCVSSSDIAKYIKSLGDKWREEIYAIQTTHNKIIRPDNVLTCLVKETNEILSGFKECEICPVSITPGLVADALKYIAVGIYMYKYGYVDQLLQLTNIGDKLFLYIIFLIDSAFSTYIIPQLDILADYVRREELQYRLTRSSMSRTGLSIKTPREVLEEMYKELVENSLYYSAELVKRISVVYNVY